MVIQVRSIILGTLKRRLADSEERDRGMGLVEMIVALFILAIGLTATAAEFVTVDRVTAETAQRQAAINIAAQQQSELAGFESLNWQFSSGIPANITNSIHRIGSTFYTATTTVTNCQSNAVIVQIISKVTVTWSSASGTQTYNQYSSLAGPPTATCP